MKHEKLDTKIIDELCNDTLALEEELADIQVLILNIIQSMQETTISTTEASYISTLIDLCMIILEKIHTRIA